MEIKAPSTRPTRKPVPKDCPVTFCLTKIGGKWKPLIVHLVRSDVNRFSKMHSAINGISKQMLTKQLRELEADGILSRKVYAEVPPRVEYTVTTYGESFFPVVDAMQKWGRKQMGLYRVA